MFRAENGERHSISDYEVDNLNTLERGGWGGRIQLQMNPTLIVFWKTIDHLT